MLLCDSELGSHISLVDVFVSEFRSHLNGILVIKFKERFNMSPQILCPIPQIPMFLEVVPDVFNQVWWIIEHKDFRSLVKKEWWMTSYHYCCKMAHRFY